MPPSARRFLSRAFFSVRPGFLAFDLVNQRGERLAFDKLHGVEMDAPLATDGVDGHDVRVMQLRGGLRFVVKALQMLGVKGGREGQNLKRHAPAQGQLQRFVDNAHAAAADLAHDLEVAERIGRHDIAGAGPRAG